MNYKVKAKGADGKYFTHGNVTDGQYGPRLGLRLSPELRQLLADKKDGEWVNFSLFADDGKPRAQGGGQKALDAEAGVAGEPQEMMY